MLVLYTHTHTHTHTHTQYVSTPVSGTPVSPGVSMSVCMLCLSNTCMQRAVWRGWRCIQRLRCTKWQCLERLLSLQEWHPRHNKYICRRSLMGTITMWQDYTLYHIVHYIIYILYIHLMCTLYPLYLWFDGGRQLQGIPHQHHLGGPVAERDEDVKFTALSGFINHSAGEVEWVAKETEEGERWTTNMDSGKCKSVSAEEWHTNGQCKWRELAVHAVPNQLAYMIYLTTQMSHTNNGRVSLTTPPVPCCHCLQEYSRLCQHFGVTFVL